MKSKHFNILVILSFFVISFIACEKDAPVIPNEEELITTLNYTLTPVAGGNSVILTFQDRDGDGGNAPTINGGTLQANTSYTGTIELLNEAENPAENITEEIEKEKEEHQFFYTLTSNFDLTISYNDTDGDGNPVGLSTNVLTGAASAGNLTITLRHEPNKSAMGVTDGLLENAGGETDIEVIFPITIQ